MKSCMFFFVFNQKPSLYCSQGHQTPLTKTVILPRSTGELLVIPLPRLIPFVFSFFFFKSECVSPSKFVQHDLDDGDVLAFTRHVRCCGLWRILWCVFTTVCMRKVTTFCTRGQRWKKTVDLIGHQGNSVLWLFPVSEPTSLLLWFWGVLLKRSTEVIFLRDRSFLRTFTFF